MKRGGSAAEIETALALAQKLANKHGIDIGSIDENEPAREPINHDTSIHLRRLQYECKYTALIVQRFFNVKAFTTFEGITLVGTQTNIEIAKYVYTFLVRHFRHEWNNKERRLRNRQAFMYGMYAGIYQKLASLEPKHSEKEGLILVGNKLQIENYIKQYFGELDSESIVPDHNAATAQYMGYLAGKETNILPAVNEKKNKGFLN